MAPAWSYLQIYAHTHTHKKILRKVPGAVNQHIHISATSTDHCRTPPYIPLPKNTL
jgi:hypothetical protein